MKNQGDKDIEKILRLSWDSLESHLPYVYLKTSEGRNFHIKAILDYLEIMNRAVKLYRGKSSR